jgi:hypothetical protein
MSRANLVVLVLIVLAVGLVVGLLDVLYDEASGGPLSSTLLPSGSRM